MGQLGLQLQRSFANASNGHRGELCLFRALIAAFNSLGGVTRAKEYHGSVSHVTFSQQRGAGRQQPRCELADLLLVSYRPRRPSSVRMTWLQAKVSKRTLGCLWPGIQSFPANLEQWDLLGHRPPIKGVSWSTPPPTDLLSAAVLPSVGSFGIFYPNNGFYDMAYVVGDWLVPLRNNPGRSGTLQFLNPPQLRTHGGYQEVTTACCLQTLGDAIENELVGTPVQHLISVGALPSSGARSQWLGSLLGSLVEQDPDDILARELLTLLELRGDDPTKGTSLARSIVLLRHGNDAG